MILKRINFSDTYSKKLVEGSINSQSLIGNNPIVSDLVEVMNNQKLESLYQKIPDIVYETDPVFVLQKSCSFDVRVNSGCLILLDMEVMDDDTDNLIVWNEKDEKPMMLVDGRLEDITKENLISFYSRNYKKFRLNADWEQDYDRPKVNRDPKSKVDLPVIEYTGYLISLIKECKNIK